MEHGCADSSRTTSAGSETSVASNASSARRLVALKNVSMATTTASARTDGKFSSRNKVLAVVSTSSITHPRNLPHVFLGCSIRRPCAPR